MWVDVAGSAELGLLSSAQVLADQLGHFEHAHLFLATEHGLEFVVCIDHAFVLIVLQTILLDIYPDLLHDLGTGQRFGADDGAECGVWVQRLH